MKRIRLNRERLAELLRASRLTQNHWAMRLGLSRGHLSDLVNGKHPYPSRKTQDKLAAGLGVAFDQLFVEEDVTDDWLYASRSAFQAVLADRYLLDREIGRGGMGTVYLARDVKHGRRVAIKVLSPEVVSGIGATEFLREIRYTARLEHHHVLTLIDSGEAAGYPYYVMPYVSGGSLRGRLDEHGRLAPLEAAALLRGVAAGLDHAHASQVVHCDVKPENILLSQDHPYVTDFGIARAVHLEVRICGPRNGIDSSAGTPAYVSPEQASGSDVDARTDVYSLGCMAFELLAGVPPYTGHTTLEIVSRRFSTEVPDVRAVVPGVPGALAHTVKRAMEFEPRRRYPTPTAFAAEFERAARHASNPFFIVRAAVSRAAFRLQRALGWRARPRRLLMGDGWIGDLRYALRIVRKAPAFTAMVVGTLALGIGANTTMFSVIDDVLLRPLPYPASEQLQMVRERSERGLGSWPSYPNFEDWRSGAESLSHVAALTWPGVTTVLGGDEPARVPVVGVTRDFFDMVRVPPLQGRAILPDENRPGGPPVAVVSHRFWRDRLGGGPDLTASTLRIGDTSYEVVGVMPAGFEVLGAADVWLPLERAVPWSHRGAHVIRVVARLRDGATVSMARAELDAITARIHEQFSEDTDAVGVQITPLVEWIVGSTRRPLMLLIGASGLFLLIACTNLAGGLLAKGEVRRRELAIRASLGAARGRIVRQLLTESVVYAVLGGTAAVGVAWVSLRAVAVLGHDALPRGTSVTLDGSVLAFTGVVALVTAGGFGLLPALRLSRTNTAGVWRTGHRGGTSARSKVWRGVVAGQAAVAVVLLMGAALLVRSFREIVTTEVGYQPAGALTVSLNVPEATAPDMESLVNFHDRLRAELGAIPGVTQAGIATGLPLDYGSMTSPIQLEDGTTTETSANYRIADAGYFSAVGVPLLRGRLFEDRDGPNASHVAIINESMARRFWPDQDALGRRFYLGGMDPYRENWLTVVGVVGEARHWRVPSGTQFEYYVHYRQRPYAARTITALIRPSGAWAPVVAAVRERVRLLSADVPVAFGSLDQRLAESVSDRRFTMVVFSAFAGLAALLACAGIYGVLAYSVARRAPELGIRMALGARPAQVRRLMMVDALQMVGSGIVVGAVVAVGVSRLLESLLFGIRPSDPLALVAAVALLSASALLAVYVPIRRSARLDPVTTIRAE